MELKMILVTTIGAREKNKKQKREAAKKIKITLQ